MESGKDGRNRLSMPLDRNINVSTSKLSVQGQMKSPCKEFLEYKSLSVLNWKCYTQRNKNSYRYHTKATIKGIICSFCMLKLWSECDPSPPTYATVTFPRVFTKLKIMLTLASLSLITDHFNIIHVCCVGIILLLFRQRISWYFYNFTKLIMGTAVAQLVEALRYKSEGRGFDSRWCHWNFSLT